MAERTLSERELNRALLSRQLLLARGRGSSPKALERIGGLQAQYAPSMYIGLWSRLEGFERGSLTRALERRSVVQGTLMRETIHLVAKRDYWPLALATRRARRENWLRSRRRAIPEAKVANAARRLRERLADGPMSRAEIEELLGVRGRTGEGRGKAGASVWIGAVGQWLDLVRVPPSGTWERRRADLYAAAEDWLGPPPAKLSEEAAIGELVSSYLRGFGPATGKQIADYAGLPVKAVAPALEHLALRRFRAKDGAELLDLPRASLPDPDTPAPARFLPVWDSTLLVHARRAGILPEEYRPRVFNTRTPHSVNTFLVDGAVAGTWRHENGRVRLDPFRRLDRETLRELREEGERLAELHA